MAEKKLNITVDEKLLRQFKAIVYMQGKTVTGVLCDFIKQYVEQNRELLRTP